jgi:glycosyltransferase involved in cell wall biosynthesis
MCEYSAKKMRLTRAEMKYDPCATVDIIVACRNSAQYLREMIESVLNQDYPAVSLFVQDGGSTDKTIEILSGYPIHWTSEPDNGISQALNRAIHATEGQIIGFTSADDSLLPGAVSAAVEFFLKNPECVMIYGDCQLMDEGGNAFKIWKSRSFDIDRLIWENYIPFQTVYIKRRAMLEIGGFDERLKVAQDFDLWLRICARFSPKGIAYLPRLQGKYRIRGNSIGFANLAEAGRCHEMAVFRFLGKHGVVEMLRNGATKARSGASLNAAYLYMIGRKRLWAWKALVRALCIWPCAIGTKHGLWCLIQILGGYWIWHLRKQVQIKMGVAKLSK